MCRGKPRSEIGTNPSRAVSKSCTVSTILDKDPTRVMGATPILSKLRSAVGVIVDAETTDNFFSWVIELDILESM